MNIQWYDLPSPQGAIHYYTKDPGTPCLSLITTQVGDHLEVCLLNWKEGSEYPLTSITTASETPERVLESIQALAYYLVVSGITKYGFNENGTLVGLYHGGCIAQGDKPLHVKEFSFFFTDASQYHPDEALSQSKCVELGLPTTFKLPEGQPDPAFRPN